jgi:hypothetical protein
MDYEVVPMPCKIRDWLLNSSWDHFGLHQGKNVIVTMEFEVPKRHILRPTLSTDTVQRILRWERQKGWSSRRKAGGPWQTNVVMIMNFLGEEKMNTREWSNLIYFFPNFPFLDIH